MSEYAVDTSVAIPLMVASHPSHAAVDAWATGKTLRLAGHALAETYAVLTRLPGDARLSPPDAVTLIEANFAVPAPLRDATSLHRTLSIMNVSGGAAYDGMVALAARDHELSLATRDARARSTYEAIGVHVEIVPS